MKRNVAETIQMEYNEKHGITPKTIKKKISDVIRASKVAEEEETYAQRLMSGKPLTKEEKATLLKDLKKK